MTNDTLRDWFAGMALANTEVTGDVHNHDTLREWFPGKTSVTRAEIAARQAYLVADAMMEARKAK